METQRGLDLARSNDFELVVEVGEPFDEKGLTRVKLNRDGAFVVEQQHDKEELQRYPGEVNPDDAERIMQQVSQFTWDQHFPPRPGIPDEAIVRWHLVDHLGNARTLKVWLRDAEKDRVMGDALTLLRKNVERVTYGKLYL